MTPSAETSKSRDTLSAWGRAPFRLSQVASLSEVSAYLQLWVGGDDYYEFPGFTITDIPKPDYLLPFTDRRGIFSGEWKEWQQNTDSVTERKVNAMNTLVILFEAMQLERSYYHDSKRDFYRRVNRYLSCGAAHCQTYAIMYVLGRRRFLAEGKHPVRRFSSVVTDLVDKWISFLDTGASPKSDLAEHQHARSLPLSPPTSVKSTNWSPVNTRKRKGQSLEQGEGKRPQLVFSRETDHAEKIDHVNKVHNTVDGGGPDQERGNFPGVKNDAQPEPPMQRRKQQPCSMSSDTSGSSSTSSSPARNDGTANQAYGIASGPPGTPTKQQIGSRKRKRRGSSSRPKISVQSQRLQVIEQQMTEKQAAIAELQTEQTHLTESVQIIQKWLQCKTGPPLEEKLMERFETTLDYHGREISQSFLVELAEHKRGVEQAVEEQDQRQHKALSRLESHLNRTSRSIEGILDRFQLNHDRDMEKLRATVAAQAGIIEEQGGLMKEMRQQISRLTEKMQTGTPIEGGGPTSGGNADVAEGLLWTPKR